MTDNKPLKRRVFFVPLSDPEHKTEIEKPAQATRYMVGEVGALRAQWQCACAAELAMVETHKTNASAKVQNRHWRSYRVSDHALDCDWRKISEDNRSSGDSASTGFKDQVRDNFAVILSLNPPQTVHGADYRYAHLKSNNIPQRVLHAEEQMSQFGGRYTRVGVKEFGDIPKTLETVVDAIGHLDHVYLEYRGGMRPIKRLFQPPHKMAGRFFREAIEAEAGLAARRDRADNREKDNFKQVALFPELGLVQPSNQQMKDIRAGEKNGQMVRLRTPALRGRGYFISGDNGKLPGQTNYTHDLIFTEPEQRQTAIAGLKAAQPVWALFVPRVMDTSWYNGETARNFNAHLVVGPGMMQVGPMPSRVLAALQTPYRDYVRNPQYTSQQVLAPAA